MDSENYSTDFGEVTGPEGSDDGPHGNSAGATQARVQARVTVNNLSAGYGSGVPVLHDVSVDIEPGETLSLLGPSGCGKTTLLRAIAGLQRPFNGEITINDEVVDGPGVHMEPHRRKVGMVFQDGALFPHLTAAQNVAFGLRGRADVDRRVVELLQLVELGEYADRLPDTLSGGQRQRVALARALAPNPSVLLLDEPFSALDAGMRNQIRRDVKRILQQIGITTIVVTHDQDEAFVFGDRVALMRDGHLVQVGPSTELYDRPRDRWVAEFVGETNVVDGTLVTGPDDGANSTPCAVQTVFGLLPAVVVGGSGERDMADTVVEVLVRPEQLKMFVAEAIPPHEGAPSLPGRVESAEYFGHDVLYQLSSNGEPLAVRSADSSFGVGDRVAVRFRGRQVVVWPAGSAGTRVSSR